MSTKANGAPTEDPEPENDRAPGSIAEGVTAEISELVRAQVMTPIRNFVTIALSAVVAVPIGCATLAIWMFAGVAVGSLLKGSGVGSWLGPVWFVGGLALAFIVLVRLYRAVPTRIQGLLHLEGARAPNERTRTLPASRVKAGRAAPTPRLAALDARFKPPQKRRPETTKDKPAEGPPTTS